MTCFTAATALAFATAATQRDFWPSGAMTSTMGILVRTLGIIGICAPSWAFSSPEPCHNQADPALLWIHPPTNPPGLSNPDGLIQSIPSLKAALSGEAQC